MVINRSLWSKVCYVLATLVFLLALLSIPIGGINLLYLGLVFFTLGKVAE